MKTETTENNTEEIVTLVMMETLDGSVESVEILEGGRNARVGSADIPLRVREDNMVSLEKGK